MMNDAHALAVRLVQVDGPAPRGLVCVSEVGPKLAQVVAIGSQVVVDDVEADADALRVGGVDEPLQRRGAPVGLVYRVQRTPS